MPTFTIPKEMHAKTFEEIGCSPEVVAALHKYHCKTVEDYIDRQDKVPQKWGIEVKRILIFGKVEVVKAKSQKSK